MYCDTNQFPALPFCGSHPKNHRARGFGKNYHISFDSNLGHGICGIKHIPCACVACTLMLDQQWIYGVQLKKGTLPTCNQLYLLESYGLI